MTTEELFALDVRMAEEVMGWKVFTLEQGLHDGNTPRPHCLRVGVPDGTEALKVFDVNGNIRWWLPSRNIADAIQVAEKLSETNNTLALEDWRSDRQRWGALFTLADGHDTGHYIADTAALAICQAADAVIAQTAPAAQPEGR